MQWPLDRLKIDRKPTIDIWLLALKNHCGYDALSLPAVLSNLVCTRKIMEQQWEKRKKSTGY
jgi:hypothetical protein